ncbi:sugar phosphate isomerase/epimerase family protein [Pontitalea aquivivens]|uniref:sugar phosphate isomerase/epimerase family protein n=1 Tax=Pontitalea aquivivens TaxID=3388663 RepID=UPI0039710428
MAIPTRLICSSHTISGVLPGGPLPARHRFEDRVEACAAAGYTGMCLHFRDYRALREAGYSDRRLGAILQGAGITDVSLEFLTDWFLTGPDGAEARRNEATILEAAAGLGACSFNVGGDFMGRNLGLGLMHETFAALCNRAAVAGLTVALEIVPWSDVPDLRCALAMIDDIPNAGLVIDSWHVFRGAIPLEDLSRLPAQRILCIQINDAAAETHGSPKTDTLQRLPCGEGSFDLSSFLAALDHATVPVSVEIISADFAALDVVEAAQRSAHGARLLVDRLQARRDQTAAG